MIPTRKVAAVLIAALAVAVAAAFTLRAQPQGQTLNPTQALPPAASEMNRNLVVLDPAHGGQDVGATLGDKILEKDVTLAIVARLRAAMTAAGFTVVATRDADSATPLTSDQRAEIANRAHALACLVIHATASGSGVHLYTSALQPPDADEGAGSPSTSPTAFVPVPWDMAQAGSVSQSLRLVSDLSAALGKANLPVVAGREPVRPLDNMECPAVAIELAPLPAAGSVPTPVTDGNYQQRIAGTLTTALQAWRDQMSSSGPNAAATAKGSAVVTDPAAQAQAAAQAARTAAEAAGRATARRSAAKTTADKPKAVPGSQAGGQDQSDKDKANSEGNAAPASPATEPGDQPAQTGGTQ